MIVWCLAEPSKIDQDEGDGEDGEGDDDDDDDNDCGARQMKRCSTRH